MVSRIPHPMAPRHFAVLEDKLPAHLVEVAALKEIRPRSESLKNGFDRIHRHRSLHIFWALIA